MSMILGSTSPRRKEILSFFSLPFQQVSSDFDEETILFQGDPGAFASEIAHQKALSLAPRFPKEIILTADTVVHRKGKVYAKPSNLKEAHQMLKELSGQEHQVFTGVSVVKENQFFTSAEESRVFFHELTDAQISLYHQHFYPLDKAGGYAIQKGGTLIVKRIEGCYYNIMGLPLQTVRRLLLKVGIDLWDYLKTS